MNKKTFGYFLTGVGCVSLFAEKLPKFPSEFYTINEIKREEDLLIFAYFYNKGRNFVIFSKIALILSIITSIVIFSLMPSSKIALNKDIILDVLLFSYIFFEIFSVYISIKYNDIIKNNKIMIY